MPGAKTSAVSQVVSLRAFVKGFAAPMVPAALAFAVGCGAAGGQEGSGSAAKQPVKLVFEWPTYTPPKKEWAEWAVQTYMQKFPHVTVEPLWNSNPSETIKVHTAAGSQLDLGWLGIGFLGLHHLHQSFLPLDPLLKARKINVGDYFPTFVESVTWQGKLMAMPMGVNPGAIVFINKGHFEKAGVKLPGDTWTWDDLLAAGPKLTRGDGATTGVGGGEKVWATQAPLLSSVYFWPPSYGASWFDADRKKVQVDNPQTLEIVRIMREVWERHRICPTSKEYNDVGGLLPSFLNGNIAAWFGGTYALDPFRKATFDYDVVEPPSLMVAGKPRKGMLMAPEEIFLIREGKNIDPAADFAVWLGQSEHLTYAGNKGHIVPGHQKTAQAAFVNPPGETRPKNLQAFVRSMAYAPPPMPHPAFGDLNTSWLAAIQKYWTPNQTPNEMSAEQALRLAQQDMQRVLDDWNRANPAAAK